MNIFVMNQSDYAKAILTIALTAFALHFAWELIQCRLFFVHLALPPTWFGMLVATLGDIVLTFIAYGLVAISARDVCWYQKRPWPLLTWLILELVALTLSVAVERSGLELGRWAYRENAPMLPAFNVSLVPVLQLMILFPLTFTVARKVGPVP